MTSWTENGHKFQNSSEVYQEFLDRTGAQRINHYGLMLFGDARNEQFLSRIQTTRHIYSTGDTLSKIAYKHYGDAKLWWTLAWFNERPTDFHCNIGDIIVVPFPIEEVLSQAYNRITL